MRAGSGRIEKYRVKGAKLVDAQRPRIEVTLLDGDAACAAGARHCCCERSRRGGRRLDGMDGGALGQGERECAETGIEIGHLLRGPNAGDDIGDERRLGVGTRLQERIAGQIDGDAGKYDAWLTANGDRYWFDRVGRAPSQARKISSFGKTCHCLRHRHFGCLGEIKQHIETGIAVRHGGRTRRTGRP